MIDVLDDKFYELKIWVDADQDWLASSDEVKSLIEHGIVSISLASEDPAAGQEKVNGNDITAVSQFTRGDGSTGLIADVGLNYEKASGGGTTPGGDPGGDPGSDPGDGSGSVDGLTFDGHRFYGGGEGGDGDDTFIPGAADALLIGGKGNDNVDYSGQTQEGNRGITITAKTGAGGNSPIEALAASSPQPGQGTPAPNVLGTFKFDADRQAQHGDVAKDTRRSSRPTTTTR